jgi:hypothetical protein
MLFYVNKLAAQREAVLALLQGMDSHLTGLAGWIADWSETDLEPANVGCKVGEYLAGELTQLRRQLAAQDSQIASLLEYSNRLSAANETSAAAQVRRELHEARRQLEAAHQQTLQARLNEKTLSETIQQQRIVHERQIQALETQLADHRRLIARQHHELVDLMGEAYTQSQPAVELPG